MFQALTQNLTKIFDNIRRSGTLSVEQIDNTMRDIRIALLEADVALIKLNSVLSSFEIVALS